MEKREGLEIKLEKIINGVKGNLAKGIIIGEINDENYENSIETFLNDEISKFKEDEIKEFLKELMFSTFKKEFEKIKFLYNDENDKEINNIKVFKLEKDKNNKLKSKEATEEELNKLSKILNSDNNKKTETKEENSERFKYSTKELPKSIDNILSILIDSIKDEELE